MNHIPEIYILMQPVVISRFCTNALLEKEDQQIVYIYIKDSEWQSILMI